MARLIDIEVDEVSYVDKAANKRKFLFVKRDSTEGGDSLELTKQLKGNKDAIEALQGINSNLLKFENVLKGLLTKKDLTEEIRKVLAEKQKEFGVLKASIDKGFEELLLGKQRNRNSGGVDTDEMPKDPVDGMDGDEGEGMGAIEDSHSDMSRPNTTEKEMDDAGKEMEGDEGKGMAGITERHRKGNKEKEDDEDEEMMEEEEMEEKKKSDTSDFDAEDLPVVKAIHGECEKLSKALKELQG